MRHFLHDRRLATEGADRCPASDGLGETGQVWLDPEPFDGASGSDGGSGLDLVEDQNHAMLGAQLPDRLQVSGQRGDQADVHHDRLHDQRGDLASPLGEDVSEGLGVIERNDQG